jgi:DNA-binding NarL/FixJ family response regulator
LGVPGNLGLECLKALKKLQPDTPVLIFSAQAERDHAIPALRAGASGFLSKDGEPEELIRAVNRCLSGARYISADLSEFLVGNPGAVQGSDLHERLSAREFQIMMAIASGKGLTETGQTLGISVKTVSTYRTRILSKMRMSSNADLTEYTLRVGLRTNVESQLGVPDSLRDRLRSTE